MAKAGDGFRGGDYYRRRTCRACGSRRVTPFLDLGKMPLAGNFLTKPELGHERSYPLRIFFCHDCFLVQVLDVVSPKVLFTDYRYLSSVTTTLREHFEQYAQDLARSLAKTEDPFVVEIGCNDGVLLAPLRDLDIRALGVEPAANVAAVARDRGLDVVEGFFDERLAERIVGSHGLASAVTASNVFAHIDDLEDVVRGVTAILRPNGAFVVEVHHLRELLRGMQYDFFYHEHLCYYSLAALVPLLDRFGLRVVDAQPIPIHGGSIRVIARPASSPHRPSRRLAAMMARERREGLTSAATYARFARRVASRGARLRKLLLTLKARGKALAGYGAPGRGNTLLGYSRIDQEILPYIVDASPSRHGRFTPGTHIPILPPSEFRRSPPDYALLLAWSYHREILSRERPFVRGGGKFIVPLPNLRVVP
ncbi:MAG TPA: class I SAM-dependent methyltransferase [Thermoplasmata archaeon]|nr:class I SAM-dependent methyltransferase [Thermoplasmata archaeon]